MKMIRPKRLRCMLREARSLPLAGREPLDKAKLCFEWVVRNVALREKENNLDPPPFVLRSGQGNLARAKLFAAKRNRG